jgi:hypothetical protein
MLYITVTSLKQFSNYVAVKTKRVGCCVYGFFEAFDRVNHGLLFCNKTEKLDYLSIVIKIKLFL